MSSSKWLILTALFCACGASTETKPVLDFETDDDLKLLVWNTGKPESSDQHVTSGKKSLKVAAPAYMVSERLLKDWSGYDALDIDIFVDQTDDPVAMTLLIGDTAWAGKSTYWNRHNAEYTLKPGANTISLPVNGLYRGESGSRANELKSNIDPTQIIRFDFGLTNNAKGQKAVLYIDNMRLSRENVPAGVWAFDFGPESQVVCPGFTPISWNTVAGKNGAKAGLSRPRSSNNRARDDGYPTRLYQDFIEMGEENGEFIAELPNGDYNVWVVYDDCGYWGGEATRHTKRSIDAEGREMYVDNRGEAGPSDYLFRFENVEPKLGDSIWDLYVKDLFKPVRFKTTVNDGKLNLVFHADAPWSSKVAAVVVYAETTKAAAEKWVADVELLNRKEFESRAVFMGQKPNPLTPPKDAVAKGYWVGYPSLEQDIAMVDAPGAPDGKLARTAVRKQHISYTFAIRPLKDFGASETKLSASALKGPAGSIPATNVDLRYVQYATQRGFGNIAYTIAPELLCKVDGAQLKLSADFTRQFWITVEVPADAKPGAYVGEVTLTAGALNLKLPLTVDVLDFDLDEPDFDMGYFGLAVPSGLTAEREKNAYRDLFTILKAGGMNTYSGGPSLKFKGFGADGKPQLDFAQCDEFFKAAREAGFTRTVHAYQGPAMVSGLHDGYQIGETGRGWAQKTGKPFTEVLKIVWGAVQEHAQANNWPPVLYYMTDEPRTIDQANKELELMKAYRQAVPFVKIGGGYSVGWGDGEVEKRVQDIFRTLPASSLNIHKQKDMDVAKEQGSEVYIYNQGVTRYSFAQYQWAEMRKGVKGRIQWHLLALHGYQFYALDAREPDTAMINWGHKEIIPTIRFHRCREGSNDFRYAVTLWNLAEKKKNLPTSQAAQTWLESVSQKIGIGKRERPEDVLGDEEFRATCIEHLRKLQAAK